MTVTFLVKTDLQFEMFKRGKPMDMILVKCIFQNRFP